MATPNYKQIEFLLATHKPFVHGRSMSAQWDIDLTAYTVKSYETVIARYLADSDTWYFNPIKYSRTTSKQQTLVKRVIALTSSRVLGFDGQIHKLKTKESK